MRSRLVIALLFASAAVAGCGLLLDDDLSSNFGTGTTPSSQEGGPGTLEGGGGTDGSGPGATDGPVIEPPPMGDGGILEDGAIASFGAKCQAGDFVEAEPNDVVGQAGAFTSAACGQIAAAGDKDYFTVEVPAGSSAKFSLAYNTTGNATLDIIGPGVNNAYGGSSGGGYRVRTFNGSTAPSTYTIHLTSSNESQTYRIFVSR